MEKKQTKRDEAIDALLWLLGNEIYKLKAPEDAVIWFARFVQLYDELL